MRATIASLLLALCVGAAAQAADEPWDSLLQSSRYADTMRGSFRTGCKPGHALSTTPAYVILCPKLDKIPSSVIEAVALPCLKQHVPENVARQGLQFWSSSVGSELSRKIVREIESGVNDQLSQEDLRSLDRANKSEYGRSLSAFATDRECSAAVARAMLRYEP